ncbi:flagellar hook-basal body protein FliE [Paracoccus liaowanqingii]|uniref:Flagellar hook-basal body protein FliE n=1 Tax=Paracoccus liaowanqingii TaxID=2560053 RepID=A0A4P7HHN2_9RHOB|nr:flagellar hook-basal body complex protein FliE [Paracoccus liaowanqingii]QBX33538.1 flagellar hook-basal body protein FliE [Paracoccus liaowanqingii]TGN54314.1 flagellar hook-basal body protein FliE [Paracoccus liaowanqingii]
MLSGLNAATAYSAARQAVAPEPGTGARTLERVGQAAEDFAAQMAMVDEVSTGAMTGKVTTQQLVQTIAEAELTLNTVVAIRDKVVEAYQDILRMPV